MKRNLIIILTQLSFFYTGYAQTIDVSNTLSWVALVIYSEDDNGFFQKKENINLQEVTSIESYYGYNKKSHELYLLTQNANCVVIVNDDTHKFLKKSKSIPLLKSDELTKKADELNLVLADKFERLNEERRIHIADSIEQARQDSIRQAVEDSLRLVAEKEKAENYKKNHRWFFVPSNKKKLYCEICEESLNTKDSIFCLAIKNDTIFWSERIDGKLSNCYDEIHVAKVSSDLKHDASYQYHFNVYRDSLENRLPSLCIESAMELNYQKLLDYLNTLKKEAPNGFFLDWGWDSEYSSIEFNFRYMNTNKNTIKYIEVYFVVTNDVGDVRKTGSFKGTGPLEEWESASWSWDHSSYYVAGDASKMHISKVIITYMNGTKVTIPKNKLCFD